MRVGRTSSSTPARGRLPGGRESGRQRWPLFRSGAERKCVATWSPSVDKYVGCDGERRLMGRFSRRREVAVGLGVYAVYLTVRQLVVDDEGQLQAARKAGRVRAA